MSKIILIEELSEMTGTSVAELEKILEGFEIDAHLGSNNSELLDLLKAARS